MVIKKISIRKKRTFIVITDTHDRIFFVPLKPTPPLRISISNHQNHHHFRDSALGSCSTIIHYIASHTFIKTRFLFRGEIERARVNEMEWKKEENKNINTHFQWGSRENFIVEQECIAITMSLGPSLYVCVNQRKNLKSFPFARSHEREKRVKNFPSYVGTCGSAVAKVNSWITKKNPSSNLKNTISSLDRHSWYDLQHLQVIIWESSRKNLMGI